MVLQRRASAGTWPSTSWPELWTQTEDEVQQAACGFVSQVAPGSTGMRCCAAQGSSVTHFWEIGSKAASGGLWGVLELVWVQVEVQRVTECQASVTPSARKGRCLVTLVGKDGTRSTCCSSVRLGVGWQQRFELAGRLRAGRR